MTFAFLNDVLFSGILFCLIPTLFLVPKLYGKIEPGDLVAYMLYVTTLLSTIRRIIEFAEQFQRGMTGIERFAEIMDTPVTIADAPDAKPLVVKDGGIDFDDVSFEYPDDHNKVLHDFSLDVRPGEKLALVGPSGGGKTTLCNLIPRFYDVSAGSVTVDGVDVRDIPQHELRDAIEDKLLQWCEGKGGFFRRYDRDRYLYVFEERHLDELRENKFASLLDIVHSVTSPSGIRATVSVGVGRDGESLDENYNFAILGTEMALSRGGDQAVVKNRVTFEFFGGRGGEVERRTKVKSRVMANALSQLIQDSSKVYVMGHKFSDLDTLGAAAGVCCIARKFGTPCRIVMDANRTAAGQLRDRMLSAPEYSKAFLSPQEAFLHADSRTLLVVVDTNRPDQVENASLLEACTRVAVIDHHRRAANYISNATMSFHEPYASSACELMAELLEELVEQPDILHVEAEAMLSGIMLDTKDFTVRTGERTFEAAAFLRRAGADTSEVKKLLQTDMEHTVARYKILQTASIYRADIAIAAPTEPQERIVAAQAADELLNIAGVTASLVIYPMGNGDVFISARSIGELNVQLVMEALGGGGSRSSAAVQLHDVSVAQAVQMARAAIDDNLEN